ncbi:MAG TPA: hypothetical protein VFR78_06905 [Pyrinomonadaceae bacterium]|nr:hypothetical protein [Pyrinomonadaceae bacterium]
MKQLCFFLGFVLLTGTTAAQSTDKNKQPARTKTAAAKSAAAELDAETKERHARARSLLMALSTDARTFNDPMLRARSLARIADALWQVDNEQGRMLFYKAWEAAESADIESDRKLQEEIREKKARGGSYTYNAPPNVRREVLRLAARHDRALSEEFMEKMKAQKLEAEKSQGPYDLSGALSQRLSLANEMLRSDEIERAIQIAEPALAVVSTQTINFLINLREKDPAAADSRYAAMLGSSANNPQADANTVSMLASYIFTPGVFVIFTGNGTSTSQMRAETTPAAVTPQLRNAFFQAASAILLRPLPPPGQDAGPAGIDGKFLVIKRVLPFFEQYAPAEMVESLRGHLNALNAVVSEGARKRDEELINRGTRADKPAADREQALLDRIERAKTSAERDSLYIQLAQMMASRGEMKARDYASKVEDPETRKQFQAYLDASLALVSVQKKLTDQALELAQKGELTHILRVWVLTESAKLIVKTDKDKAVEIVDEAATTARRIDVSDPALPRALIAVANALKVVDPGRVWDAAFDAVKAANSAEGFSGEDGEIVLQFKAKSQSSIHTNNVSEFDLEGIFKELANLDYERAVELARGFQLEGPRAVATIAIARAVLEPKKAAKQAQ